ncbi:MAG: ABC transporter ATP-binding protein [Cyclonatronaceae bacterium]
MQLTIADICKSFGPKQVLDKLHTQLESGNAYALLGKNGAGKTTLINILLHLVQADAGHFLLDDAPLDTSSRAWKRRVGVVSDEVPLVPQMTGRECLEFHACLYDVPPAEARPRIDALLHHFFEDVRDTGKEVRSYSTGMRKKIEICAAVLHTPDVLLLDEPFSGLDPVAARELISFLNTYRRPGRILLLSSHDLAYVQQCVSHVLVLDEARFKFDGSTEAFLRSGNGKIDGALFLLLVSSEKSGDGLEWMQ